MILLRSASAQCCVLSADLDEEVMPYPDHADNATKNCPCSKTPLRASMTDLSKVIDCDL